MSEEQNQPNDESVEAVTPDVIETPAVDDIFGELIDPQPAKKKKKEKTTVEVPVDKYNKLVAGATKVLEQYRKNHQTLSYPGMQELAEGLE